MPERILIVEDDEERCAWFGRKFAGREMDVTCDVGQALAWLSAREYAVILLDHDLAEEHYYSDAPDDERTGYAVAAWLASHPSSQRDAMIVIHSLNYVGAKRMLDTLHDAGRDAEHVPFHYLQTALRM
ncbi:MAG: Cyclic-phosphate processing Receiver domain [Blastocatellia bacterium]|jgi:CheY-like chemotaxis protein|nr:Cyclic-phosphate processing Receiver domain [Blastocatellia bacterium]